MIVSASLGVVPFLGNTDATRLQMCGKQLNQAVSHPNTRRPFVIGDEYKYLSEMSKFYKYIAPSPGKIIYKGTDITIIIFDEDNKSEQLKVFETPKFKHCANGFATQLINYKSVGPFAKGDIIYEYDSFKEDVPCYGYNLNVAYMPWFGLNFEDAIVISESAADLMRCNKVENVIIPIYSHSLFRNLYADTSKYGFLPEVGQKISDNIILYQSVPKDDRNKNQLLKSISLYDLTSIAEDNFLFNSVPIISKLPGGTVTKLKVHHINRNVKLADEKNLGMRLKGMHDEYSDEVEIIHNNISELFGEKYARRIASNHLVMQRYGSKRTTKDKIGIPVDMHRDDLVYVIELEISKEYKTKIGDKISNRYANKGVISQIIPDELRPINTKTGEPIDIVISPLSVFSRMNFGQTIEGLLNKVIKHCEEEILLDPDKNINYILNNLVNISDIIGNKEYSNEIKQLNSDIHTNPEVKKQFINSIKTGGLYFEAPCFASFDLESLINISEELFGINTNDSIKIPKETFPWVREQLKFSKEVTIPDEDVIYEDIYNAPIYMIKLMQLAENKLNVRDFGEYSASKKQPTSDKNNLNKASKIGNMEFDAFLAHNCMNVIRELRTVKSDAMNLKSEMVSQLINTGVYDLPTIKPKSFTRDIIKSYIKFLNEN
jgi:DNA-directed RNA polymerase beta subunit